MSYGEYIYASILVVGSCHSVKPALSSETGRYLVGGGRLAAVGRDEVIRIIQSVAHRAEHVHACQYHFLTGLSVCFEVLLVVAATLSKGILLAIFL